MPKWLRFPAQSYTVRPFATLAKWKQVEPLIKGLPVPTPQVDAYAVAAE